MKIQIQGVDCVKFFLKEAEKLEVTTAPDLLYLGIICTVSVNTSRGMNTPQLMIEEYRISDGNAVYLVYKKADNGYDIEVHNKVQNEGWAKCTLGTAGGAGGGGLAGAGIGTSVPVIGTAAGAIIGGVSGAATGAATSCFKS